MSTSGLDHFQASQPFEPQSAIVILPIDPPLERRGIGQCALGKARSGTGRTQRPVPDNRRSRSVSARDDNVCERSKEKMRQENQSANAIDRQQPELVRRNAPPRFPRQDPDLAGIIPGAQPLELG